MHKAIKEIGFARLIKYFIFGLWKSFFYLLPYSPLRVFWLRLGGATIGSDSVIDRIDFTNLDRTGLKGLIIGNQCYLGTGVLFDLAGKIVIEDKVTVVARSIILTHNSVGLSDHPLIKHYPKKVINVTLHSGCVIGVASIVLPGVTIGKNSFVAGGAVVTKSIPSGKLVAGVPAVIKKTLHEKNS